MVDFCLFSFRHHKKVIIHVPYKIKHIHHTHTVYKHVHDHGHGDHDYYKVIGYSGGIDHGSIKVQHGHEGGHGGGFSGGYGGGHSFGHGISSYSEHGHQGLDGGIGGYGGTHEGLSGWNFNPPHLISLINHQLITHFTKWKNTRLKSVYNRVFVVTWRGIVQIFILLFTHSLNLTDVLLFTFYDHVYWILYCMFLNMWYFCCFFVHLLCFVHVFYVLYLSPLRCSIL